MTYCASVDSRTFWRETAERALKTFAQVLLALLISDAAVPTNIFSIDWVPTLGISLAAALISVLTSIASAKSPFGTPGSPSLVDTPGRHAAR